MAGRSQLLSRLSLALAVGGSSAGLAFTLARVFGWNAFGVDQRPLSAVAVLAAVALAASTLAAFSIRRARYGVAMAGLVSVVLAVGASMFVAVQPALAIAGVGALVAVPVVRGLAVQREAARLEALDADALPPEPSARSRAPWLVVGAASAAIVGAVVGERMLRFEETIEIRLRSITDRPTDSASVRMAPLPDGGLLMTGGVVPDAPDRIYADLLRWDPEADAWDSAGQPDFAGARMQLVTLSDSNVLVLGQSTAEAAVYDPETDALTPLHHSALVATTAVAVLPDGEVLILDADELERYRPPDTWRSASPAPVEVKRPGLIGLRDGLAMLVTGDAEHRNRAFIYDPKADAWERLPDPAWRRATKAMIELDEDRVLLVGEERPELGAIGDVHPSAEVFDRGAGEWIPTGPLPTPLEEVGLVGCGDGGVLAVGIGRVYQRSERRSVSIRAGSSTRAHPVLAAYLDPDSGRWLSAGLLDHEVDTLATAPLSDGAIVFTGGKTQRVATAHCPG